MSDFRPERILAAFEQADVGYVTVGGMALIAHGVVRATLDLDLVPDPGAENLARLAGTIRDLGGFPHGEPHTPVTAALLGRRANMRFSTDAGQIDVLAAEQYLRLYPDLSERAVVIDVEGVTMRVVSRNDLVRLKAGSGRDRDLLDIGDLLALEE